MIEWCLFICSSCLTWNYIGSRTADLNLTLFQFQGLWNQAHDLVISVPVNIITRAWPEERIHSVAMHEFDFYFVVPPPAGWCHGKAHHCTAQQTTTHCDAVWWHYVPVWSIASIATRVTSSRLWHGQSNYPPAARQKQLMSLYIRVVRETLRTLCIFMVPLMLNRDTWFKHSSFFSTSSSLT